MTKIIIKSVSSVRIMSLHYMVKEMNVSLSQS